MAKQTFTTGQVLTAAQLTSLQQTAMLGGAASAKTANYTLVAADAGTAISMSSTSATTITVNTGLFAAGDTVQITNLNTGVCTITAGTATVNTSASLALAQYESGTLAFTSASAAIFIKGAGAAAAGGGMTLISETVASAVSSIEFASLGSFKQLVMIWSGIQHSTTGSSFNFRFNNDSGSNYYNFTGDTLNGNADTDKRETTFAGGSGHGITLGAFGTQTNGSTLEKTNFGTLILDNYTSTTKAKSYQILFAFWIEPDSQALSVKVNGVWKDTSAITTLDIVRTAGAATFSNFTNTTIRLYGVS